ncbi:hypothetical protein B0H14DRAFT_3511553 [Mycena olivaceomarginata]|nr:hypothetical protein B0H14DRAFT_3511553 [Mycena olivaceomarginata]
MTGPGFATLPLDLQRTIFEIAARSQPTEMLSQMRVAWRVKHWVEPFLYRVILISPLSDTECIQRAEGFPSIRIDPLLEKIRTKGVPFFRSSVTHIFFEPWLVPPLKTVLEACPLVKTLYFAPPHHNPEYVPILNRLECLHRLTLDDALFGDDPLDFSQPLFRNLTHLEILDYYDDDMGANIGEGLGMGMIPHLTHLALNTTAADTAMHPEIRAHSRLECIVFLISHATARRTLLPKRHPDSDDDRFVLIQQRNFRRGWFRGAAGRRDYWSWPTSSSLRGVPGRLIVH